MDAAHEQFEMITNDAYTTNAVEIANAASMTAGNGIPVTQNAAYGQVPPGTDDYDYFWLFD